MSSNPSSVKKETKKNVAKTSRITLKSAYGRHAGQSSVNVARFVGIHKNEKLDLAHLPAPVKMVRDPPPETPDWLVEKNARRKGKYQVSELAKDEPMVYNPNSDHARKHRRITMSCGDDKEFFGSVEAGSTASYVLFVNEGPGEFSVIPCDNWYTFKKAASFNENRNSVPLEAIEKHMQDQRRNTGRLVTPKEELRGIDSTTAKKIKLMEKLENSVEPMDQEAFEITATKKAAKEDGDAPDFFHNNSDDEGDGEIAGATVDNTLVKNEMKTLGVVEETADDKNSFDDAAKKLNKLLKREDGDESSSDEEENDANEDNEDDDDDDDGNDAVDSDDDVEDKKPSILRRSRVSGVKRKMVENTTPTESHATIIEKAMKLRSNRSNVKQPSSLSMVEIRRYLKACGALTTSELVQSFRIFMSGDVQNKSVFSQFLRELTNRGELVIDMIDNQKYLRLC